MSLLIALLLAGADARFEADGLRFHDVLHRGALLELREGALVSGRVLEPLSSAVRVDAGDGLTLVLEPGVRVSREADGLRLSAHGAAKLRMSTLEPANAFVLTRGPRGWSAGATALAGEVEVSLQAQQEDPDAALRAMQEAARKMRESSQRVRLPLMRRIFTGHNPFTAGEPAGSQDLRQLAELSATGF